MPDLSDHETIKAHKEVIGMITKNQKLIPEEYSDLNLIDIIMPKAYGYHTGFDVIYKRYKKVSKVFNMITRSKFFSNKIAYKIIKNHNDLNFEYYENNKDEMIIDYSNMDNKLVFNEKYDSLFFANAQSYLRVMSLYMQKSNNRNLLIVPKYLSAVQILNNFDSSKVFFYEDFMNDEIIIKYKNAQKTFSKIYNDNQDKLNDYFTIELKSFFPIIKNGFKNIYYYLLPQAVLCYLTNKEIFKKIKVKNIVGARVRKIFDRAFYESSKEYDINRYVLLHSNIGNDVNFLHSMGNFNDITGVFTWGDQQKHIIQNDIFSNVGEIYSTGSPLFENACNENKSTNHNRIIYAATNNDFYELSEVAKAVKKFNGEIELFIKVHPGDDSEPYNKFCDEKYISLIAGEKILEDLLPNASLLITTISESALQGMLFKIPTLMLLIDNKWEYLMKSLYAFDKDEEKILVIRTKERIKERIKEIIFNEEENRIHLKEQNKIFSRRILVNNNPSSVNIIDELLN